MELSLSSRAGKLAYGALFMLIVPVGLWFWNSHLSCPLPAVHSVWAGAFLLAAAVPLILVAMRQLWREGGGLPMNAYPPPRLATRGIYAVVPHPIYCGFIATCAGVSLLADSATGLWIITPIVALGCMAILFGYEIPDLRRRFGNRSPSPWLCPPKGEGFLPLSRRIGTLLGVLLLWGIAYKAVKLIGVPSNAFETRFGWEWAIPTLPASMPLYASIYLAVPLLFLRCSDRTEMRRLVAGFWVALGLNTLVYVTVPATAVFRSVPGDDWLSRWLAWEQHLAEPAAGSFPSFHVTWAFLCAASLARGASRKARWLVWAWGLALTASCLTTGMHSLADLLAGAFTGLLCAHPQRFWAGLVGAAETLSNSWRAWQLGSLRIMNHGVWSGLAGFTALCLAAAAAAGTHPGWILFVAGCALAGAALWAQWIEGCSALLRPFGYYGAILGGLGALLLVVLANGPATALLGAFAVAAPWTQAVGRLRCLVQGCCHGRPVSWGIRVTNPHSRVVKLAGFSNTPIHPTPLYSILANLAMGLLLLRLRLNGTGPFFLAGLYLLLAGISRFIEEAYRGEPQTRRFAGLPLYQWMAVGSLALGMVLMAWPDSPQPAMRTPGTWIWLGSAAWGLVCAFALSMDVPHSTRRFSRLTG